MVTRLLGLAEAPRPADAADALGLAICHCWAPRCWTHGRGAGAVGELAAGTGARLAAAAENMRTPPHARADERADSRCEGEGAS